MSLDPTWLFLSLFPSGLGFVLLSYGRKQGRWPHMVGGLALLVYPYFVTSITMLVVVGLVIVGMVWYAAAE